VSEPRTFKYRAFLSYSHRDTRWAKWLHAALEGYRIDKDLAGRPTPAGAVPKSLRLIFRDREDFSAGHSLTEQTEAALEASRFMVVLCSPNALKSQWATNVRVRRGDAAGSSHPRPELRLVVENDVAPRDEPWTLKLDPAITHKPGVARSRRHVRTEQNMGSDNEAISSVIGSTEDARNALVRCIVPAKRLGIPPLRRRPLMN